MISSNGFEQDNSMSYSISERQLNDLIEITQKKPQHRTPNDLKKLLPLVQNIKFFKIGEEE